MGFDYIYSPGGGGGSRTETSGGTYADIAARDAHYSTEFGDLLNNDNAITVINISDIETQQWAGEDAPASYDPNGWITTVYSATSSDNIENLSEVLGTSVSDALDSLQESSNPFGGTYFEGSVSTTDDIWTTIVTIPTIAGDKGTVNYVAIAIRTDVDAVWQRTRQCNYINNAGVISETGDTLNTVSLDAGNIRTRENITSNDINIQIRGVAGESYDWLVRGLKTTI